MSVIAGRGRMIWGVVAWIAGIAFFFPVVWMVFLSLHAEPDTAANPPDVTAPLTLQGYREFFGTSTGASPWPYLINSATASVASTLLVLVLALMAAYALAIRPVRRWTDTMFFFLIRFIFSWNEMLFARVLTGVVAGTAPVFLTGFVTSQGLFLAKVCAAATVISVPVLIAGFAAQNKLVQGLSLGAVK